MVSNLSDHKYPKKVTLPDSRVIDKGEYYDEIHTSLYNNSQCPVCDFQRMTITIKLFVDIEKRRYRYDGIVYTSCDKCTWKYSSQQIIASYSNNPSIFWLEYVDSWNKVNNKKKTVVMHNKISYNENLMIWEKKKKPNIAICPICQSQNVLISSGTDINEWYLYDCNDCKYHLTNNNIDLLPDDLIKSFNIDKHKFAVKFIA